MAWWLWRVRCPRTFALAFAVALVPACDGAASSSSDGQETADETESSTSAPGSTSDSSTASTDADASSEPASGNPTTDPSGPDTDPTETSGSESGDEGPSPGDGWIEIGYVLDAFFPFEGELPLTLGPQGFMMFSLPLRGGGFPVPPNPFDFDHPDTPVLSVWTDIEGIEGTHPTGHFAAYVNYPVPFALSDEEGVQYEFVSVWLVIPETYTPAELAGREAVVHAELNCSDGQVLIDEHVLTVADATGAGKGEGEGR